MHLDIAEASPDLFLTWLVFPQMILLQQGFQIMTTLLPAVLLIRLPLYFLMFL